MTTSTRTRLQWISTVVRVALAVIMLWAGLAKLLHPDEALRAVQAYRIFPASIDDLVAVVLPIVEATVGILLLLGLGTRLAAWVTAGLMIVFIAGVASAWIRGLSIDCGCFGGGGDVPSAGRTLRYILEILRDTGFLLMAAWLVGFPASRMALDRLPGDIAVRIDEDVTDPDTTNENA
jgi:uncharacterized membrane protein YphA (DoxX/SURF4 family)